ncbi:MAG: hypothetical protein ACYC8T_30075 [Myxococcaceae bacterium]
MPPDVFLVLASSGIAFVASLMFLVSDDPVKPSFDDPRLLTSFTLPPLRTPPSPPPLPRGRAPRLPVVDDGYGYEASIGGTHFRMRLSLDRQTGGWLVDVDYEPLADTPALRIDEGSESGPLHGSGQVNDLRWNGRAGIARRAHARWRKPPADA